MLKVPETLARRLYVPRSLSNTEHGFRFALRNVLGTGDITELKWLQVNGEQLDHSKVAVGLRGVHVPATSISPEVPLSLEHGDEVEVTADGVHLQPGRHRVELAVTLTAVGGASMAFIDEI